MKYIREYYLYNADYLLLIKDIFEVIEDSCIANLKYYQHNKEVSSDSYDIYQMSDSNDVRNTHWRMVANPKYPNKFCVLGNIKLIKSTEDLFEKLEKICDCSQRLEKFGFRVLQDELADKGEYIDGPLENSISSGIYESLYTKEQKFPRTQYHKFDWKKHDLENLKDEWNNINVFGKRIVTFKIFFIKS